MARIFISYSRADRQFVDDFVPLVRKVYGLNQVWFDDDIIGGDDWWQRILTQIAQCELFIYLLSNEALASPYCQAEFREALRLQKPILPVIVRPKTQVTDDLPVDVRQSLHQTQRVDLSREFRDYQANAALYAAINRLLEHAPPSSTVPLTSEPVREPVVPDSPARRRLTRPQVFILVAIIIGLFVVVTTIIALSSRGTTATATSTAAAEAATSAPSPTSRPTEVATNAPSVTERPTTTITPPPEPSLDPREIALATRDTGYTQTATRWTTTPTATSTPTPNFDATVAAELTALVFEEQTMTATLWTPTPPATRTPTVTKTPTLLPGWPGGQKITANADWQPVIEWPDAGFVEMVMVPIGCFMMGSVDGRDDEQPVHEVCFEHPFYLDRFEVTRAQYARCIAGGSECREQLVSPVSRSDEQPINNVDWFDAYNYCAWRGARLPTEAEWAYAARGPDNWVYPWGDEFVADNVVHDDNADEIAIVGADHRPDGMSWVGAYDMSGNVAEWVNSEYGPYPYDPDDGREDPNRTATVNVLRGGAFDGHVGSSLRSAARIQLGPESILGSVGIRCARDF